MLRRAGGVALAGTLALAASAADLNGPMASSPAKAGSGAQATPATAGSGAQGTPAKAGSGAQATPAASSAAGPAPAAAPAAEAFDVNRLFAGTCGWCHSNGGRVAGKGPQLMNTRLTDAEIITRVKTGKAGAMPAFGTAFNDEQLQAIVRYIRGLKPEGATQ